MALTCGFYNSVDGDRKYDATQFASLFDGVITDGVVAAVGDFFATTPGGGMVVNVGSGRAWFNRTWTYSDATIPFTLDASDLLYDRIDAVVLEIDTRLSIRDNSIKVIKGTPAQEPANPSLTNSGDIHQYVLSYVRVKAGAIEIGAGDITTNVGQADCPFVTSIIETPELDVLFAQWDAQFTAWFENVQSQLEGDIAANLQKQIDERVKIIDKATVEEALDKNNDTAWLSPKMADISIYGIGDVKVTRKQDLGSDWLLCNGASVSRDNYPELSDFYPVSPEGTANSWVKTVRSSHSKICIVQWFKKVNEYFVYSYLEQSEDEENVYLYVVFSKELGVDETKIQLVNYKTPTPPRYRQFDALTCDILYDEVERRYIIASVESYSSHGNTYYKPALYYSDEPANILENWQKVSINVSSEIGVGITSFKLLNGYFILVPASGSKIIYTATPYVGSSWALSEISIDNLERNLTDITFYKGNYIITGSYRNKNSGTNMTIYSGIYYSASIASGWKFKEAFSAVASSGTPDPMDFIFYKILKTEDKLIFSGTYSTQASISTPECRGAIIGSLDDIQTKFKVLTLWEDWQTNNFSKLTDIIENSGWFITCGMRYNAAYSIELYIAYSKDLVSWSKVKLYNIATDSYHLDILRSSVIGGVVYDGRFFRALYSNPSSGSMTSSSITLATKDTGVFNIPNISLNGVYTYIRAKIEKEEK